MSVRTVLLIAATALLVGSLTAPAHAKRARPPKTEICNKTKVKQYVAVRNYAGRGHHSTRGWTFIAPGACHTFHDDSFHIRGSATVTGLMVKSAHQACVKNSKVFRIMRSSGKSGDKAACATDKGRLVSFRRPIRLSRGVSQKVVISPRARRR